MAAKKRNKPTPEASVHELLKIGDRVRIRYYGGQQGEVVEYRGPLGPGGSRVYRLLLLREPIGDYIELREDQIELIQSDS